MKGLDLKRVVVAIALLLSAGSASAQSSAPISRPQLEAMFANMKSSAPWNVDGPLLWGYFFTGSDRSALERAGQTLAGRGYRLVDVRLGEKKSPRDADVWWLHVERVEHHTVDSLQTRNTEFYSFAAQQGLGSYDGMDVGPAN
jgi:hypothetical protein